LAAEGKRPSKKRKGLTGRVARDALLTLGVGRGAGEAVLGIV